jgi:aryl-alcohol dehydrogenase-like predicted oxidoreductase
VNPHGPQLALGTVQFGVGYGIAGLGAPVPEVEVRQILQAAAAAQVQVLDTAAAYGSIEQRLAPLMAGLNLRVVSKIAALPVDAGASQAAELALASARLSRQRLGDSLDALLLHRAEDLLDARGEAVWCALDRFGRDEGVRLGVSCYDPDVLRLVRERFPIALAQASGNAFDQRVRNVALNGLELHLRSAFLQGLLLMPPAAARARLPAAAAALLAWHEWLGRHGGDALVSALSIVRGFRGVGCVIIGVDGLRQFEAALAAWQRATPIQAPELACDDLAVIDPRTWKVAV